MDLIEWGVIQDWVYDLGLIFSQNYRFIAIWAMWLYNSWGGHRICTLGGMVSLPGRLNVCKGSVEEAIFYMVNQENYSYIHCPWA